MYIHIYIHIYVYVYVYVYIYTYMYLYIDRSNIPSRAMASADTANIPQHVFVNYIKASLLL